MRYCSLILLMLIISCKPCQSLNLVVKEAVQFKGIKCPDKGECTIEIIPDKNITFKKDNTGVLYPEITEGEKTLIKFTFKKNPVPNTQDSNYSEIIYAELNRTISEMTVTDDDLQKIKLHFGRFCYCKGGTGYFAVKEGVFKISKNDKNSFDLDFDFKIEEVPHIITTINESISLN